MRIAHRALAPVARGDRCARCGEDAAPDLFSDCSPRLLIWLSNTACAWLCTRCAPLEPRKLSAVTLQALRQQLGETTAIIDGAYLGLRSDGEPTLEIHWRFPHPEDDPRVGELVAAGRDLDDAELEALLELAAAMNHGA